MGQGSAWDRRGLGISDAPPCACLCTGEAVHACAAEGAEGPSGAHPTGPPHPVRPRPPTLQTPATLESKGLTINLVPSSFQSQSPLGEEFWAIHSLFLLRFPVSRQPISLGIHFS